MGAAAGAFRVLTAATMAWPNQRLHVLDFEGSLASGVLEYGIVAWQSGRILQVWTRRCRPTGTIRAQDAAVHGLEASALQALPGLAEDFPLFAGLRQEGPLVAHFASAENTLIKSVWPYPRHSPDFLHGGTVLDWGPWVDTGRLFPQLFTGLASARLEDLIATFGLQSELDEVARQHCPTDRCRYHAALYDALACALLLTRLAREPAFATQSLQWLLERSTLDPARRADFTQGDLFG